MQSECGWDVLILSREDRCENLAGVKIAELSVYRSRLFIKRCRKKGEGGYSDAATNSMDAEEKGRRWHWKRRTELPVFQCTDKGNIQGLTIEENYYKSMTNSI